MSIGFGRFALIEERRQLTKDGEPLALSPKAFQLLQMLIGQRPNVVPKDKLIELLWPDVTVEEANVRNLIAEIRDAIGNDLIRTVHRFGYAFEGAVRTTERVAARLDDALRAYPVAEGTTMIGRDLNCAIVVDARGVSRQHARIHLAAGTAELEDLGSKNGTLVNGVRVESLTPLSEGDKIQIGTVMLTFHLHTQSDSTSSV
jgi:DNA-binding winged helix-turn-helix (wHTH) protein